MALLGTSEAIRLSSTSSSSSIFYKANVKAWLAGLIDGDGCFTLSKKGYAALEITMDLKDSATLYYIKQIYGGSIKLRSGVKAIRYRLHHKEGILLLIKDINGLIRNPNRLAQLNKICINEDIPIIYPSPLVDFHDPWVSGFFDSHGSITLNTKTHKITISISQKNKLLLDPLVSLYKGGVYLDNSKYISYKWSISSKSDILNKYNYFKICPLRSSKKARVLLIPQLLELKAIKAHLADPISDPLKWRAWNKLANKFKNFGYEDDE